MRTEQLFVSRLDTLGDLYTTGNQTTFAEIPQPWSLREQVARPWQLLLAAVKKFDVTKLGLDTIKLKKLNFDTVQLPSYDFSTLHVDQRVIQLLTHPVVLLVLPFIITYLFTVLDFRLKQSSKKLGRKAPLVPYSVPIIGHALHFAISVGGLIQSNLHRTSTFAKYSPIRFRGMGVELSFVSGPKNVAALFRQSRKFSAKASVVIAIDRLFGTPKHLVSSFYDRDNTGYDLKPAPQSRNIEPHLRIHYTVHTQVIKYLSGSGLKPMMQTLMTNIGKTMYDSGVSTEWLEMDDLFEFCRMKLLHASVTSMFGEYLTSLHPEFVADYWAFDSHTTTLVKGFPQFVVPEAWRARRKCLDTLKHWKAYVARLCEADGGKDYEGIDPFYGSQFIRQRHEAFGRMQSMNADSMASEDLAIMWASNSNAIPAAYWFCYEIFRDPALYERVKKEVDAARLPCEDATLPPRFDLEALTKAPLLQSVYAEILRLQTAILVARMPEHNDFKLGDHVFEKDKLMVAASYVAHQDADVWNTGTPEAPRPLNKFWAERFLIKSGDERSGPLNPCVKQKDLLPRGEVDAAAVALEQTEKVRFSSDGLSGAFVPYGGGQSLCPGRHYAKQEMLMTFAILSTSFEIEILHKPGEETKPDMTYFGLGVLPPATATPCRIRRRKVTSKPVVIRHDSCVEEQEQPPAPLGV